MNTSTGVPMEHDISTLVSDFEAGKLSRRQLISSLTVAAAATAVVAAPVTAEAAAASTTPITRKQMVPGLGAPGTAEKPSYSHITSSTRKKMIFVAGQLARDRYQRNVDELNENLRNGAKILIDITAAQRNQLDAAMAGAQVTASESKANLVKPDEEHVLWPFNGEYWRDELGFYRQSITSKCGR